MPLFSLRKWYFDVVTDEDVYLFFYIAQARLAARTDAHFHLTAARLGSSRIESADVPLGGEGVVWNPDLIHTEYGEVRWQADETVIRFTFRDASLRLRFIRSGGDPGPRSLMVIPVTRKTCTVWTPAAAQCVVDGEAQVSNRLYSFHKQNGYYDLLESNGFPARSPVRRLLWGRLHGENLAFTFTIANGKNTSHQWEKALLRLGESFTSFDRLSVAVQEWRFSDALQCRYPSRYELRAEDRDLGIVVSVDRIQEAVVSDFLDDQRIANPAQRMLYTWIGKDPRGIKFFSIASLRITGKGIDRELHQITMIDEFVRFGALLDPAERSR
jgi:hypothetical protein